MINHSSLKKLLLTWSLLGFVVCFFACSGQKSTQVTGGSNKTWKHLDTAHPSAFYQQLINLDKNEIDTIYQGLYDDLSEHHRYELLLDHMEYYARLKRNDPATKAFVEKAKGYAYSYLAKYDSAESFFRNAERIDSQLHLKRELASVYGGLGSNYLYKGDYARSLEYSYRSLAIYEQLHDSLNIFYKRSDIAVCLYHQREFDKAIAITKECLAYFQRVGNRPTTAYMLSILATCYYGKREYATSLDYGRSSLAIRRELADKHEIAESLNNLALVFMASNMWDSSTVVLSESLELMKASNDMRQLPIIRQNLAVSQWKKGRTSEAIANLSGSIAESIASGQKNSIANGYRQIYVIYKEKKMYDSALENYRRFRAWRDSLYDEEKAKIIGELNIKYETQKKENRIVELSLEKRLEKARNTAYLVVVVILIIAGAIIILLLTDRNRKNRLLIAKVKAELEDNKRNLASFTDSIIAKNKFIEELEAKLHDTKAQAEKDQEKESEYLGELYQFKILTEDDWAEFKIRFDKAYPGYINRLRQHFPDLAAGEERQFLLIKLNINIRECASMLGISADSVKKNRYRLKKKFNLSEEDSLDDFVRSF